MNAGKLREQVALDAPLITTDEAGGRDHEWQEAFVAPAEIRYERGTEDVQGGGLTGITRFKVRIRAFSLSRAVTTDYRLRDLRSGLAFNIRGVDAMSDRGFVWLAVEGGVAT